MKPGETPGYTLWGHCTLLRYTLSYADCYTLQFTQYTSHQNTSTLTAPVTKAIWGDSRQISHRTVYKGYTVNIPPKAFCHPMCFLFVSSESCFYTLGRMAWVGLTIARGEDGQD